MSEQAEKFYSEMYSVQDNRISWGEYVARLYDTDEIELLTEQEIVRCRDCKYYDDFLTSCEWWGAYERLAEPDGFCKWGVRRDA